MYRITAVADAVLRSENTSSSYDVPQFLLNGYVTSPEDAVRVARDIIDPLNITTVHITAERVPDVIRENDVAAVKEQLRYAVEELNGPNGPDPVLFGLAESVATLLGVDLNDLPGNDEEDE